MIKKLLTLSLPFIFTAFFIGCNDSPTDLGSEFVDQDGIEVKKIDSSVDTVNQFSSYFKRVLNLGSSDHLLLGKAENVTAHTLLRFVFVVPDSIRSEIENRTITVMDSYVELTKDYIFGDSAANFDYSVYKINSGWSSSTFTADSLATLSYDDIDLSTQRTTSNDTIYSFHLDTTLVSSWLINYVDTTLGNNYGILLTPTGNTSKVLGFTAFNVNGINDPRLRIVIYKPGWIESDTLVGYISADVSAVIGDVKNTGSENLTIQSSLTSEAKIFFDLSVIPPNSVVNSALLTLTIDTVETKTGSSFINSLRAGLIKDSTTLEVDNIYVYTLNKKDQTYSGEITKMVRAWQNNVANLGILIKATSEYRGIEIFSIKGSNAANVAQRPKLEIFYSRKKY